MTSGIYEIVNTINGKRYIGSAMNLVSRWKSHRNRLIAGGHANRHLQSSWNKHGEAAFQFSLMMTVEDKTKLTWWEQRFFEALKPEYNICPTAGSQLGSKRAPGFQVGRKQPESARKKISEAHRGKKAPEVAEANRQRIVTEDTRKKMSDNRRGKKQSSEHVANRAKAMIGNTNALGKKFGPEQCANISKGLRESWARRKALEESLQIQPQGA